MSTLSADDPDFDILRLVVENIFVPLKLPQKDHGKQTEQRMNFTLCDRLVEASRDFLSIIFASERPLWTHMVKMMELARRVVEVPFEEADLQRIFSNMAIGGTSMPV